MNLRIRNVSFKVSPHEHEIYWSGIGSGHWEKETFDLIDSYTSESSVLLDIGSWAGPITLYAAAKCKKVYALEPDPAIFPQLIENLSLNPDLSNSVASFQLALATKTGQEILYARNQYGQSSSSILARSRDHCDTETCRTISLKDFITKEEIKEVHFIKMDIEGGEFLILPELGETLKELNYPSLFVSFHFQHLLESVLREKIQSAFFSKLLLKLAHWNLITPFKTTLEQKIRTSFKAFSGYSFIYSEQGVLLSQEELLENPQFIKQHNLLVTNHEWENHD